MTVEILQTMRELHSRTSDGIHVRLLWGETDGRLAVAVADATSGDSFAVEVRDRARALHVFHHPYAYAGAEPVISLPRLAAAA